MASPYRPTARSWERPTHRGASGSMYGAVHHYQAQQQQQQQRPRELDESSGGGYAEDGASLPQEHFYSPPHGGRNSSAVSSPSRHHGSFDPRSPAPLLVAEENRQLRRQQEDLLDRCRELEQQLAYARAPAANDSSPERVSRVVLRRSPSPRGRHTADGYDDEHGYAEGASTPRRHRQRRDDATASEPAHPDATRSAVVSDIALEQLRDLNGKLQRQQQDNVVLSKRVNELEELLLKSKASERDAVARAADASRAYLQARRGVAGGAMDSSHTADVPTSDHRGDQRQPQQPPEPDSDGSPARDATPPPPPPRRQEERQHQQQPQRAPAAQQPSGPSSPLPLLPQDARAAEVAASPARAQESPPRDPFAAPPSTSTVFGGRPASSPSPSRSGPAGAPQQPRLSKTPSVPATAAPRKGPPAKLPPPNCSGTGQASAPQAAAGPTAAAAPSKLALPPPSAKPPAPATADDGGAGGTPPPGGKKAMLPQPPGSKLPQPASGGGPAPSASSSGPMPAVMPSPPQALKQPKSPGAPAGGESLTKLPPGPGGGAEAPRGLPSPATVHAAVSVGRWSWGAWAKSPWLVVAVLALYIAIGFGGGSGNGDGEARLTESRWAAPPPAPPSGVPPPLRGEGAEGASVSDGLAWLWWAWSAAKWLYNFMFGEVV